MALFSINNIRVAGLSGVLPKNTESNRNLSGFSDQERDLLIRTTGIEERRVAEDLCASDLCFKAAERLVDELDWDKSEIELLVYVTQTPDYIIPGTSMILQDKLGLPKSCMTLDINQGCAGYVYGLSVISNLMSSGAIKKGLLLVGDTITKLISEGDNSTRPIFSDAGTATAIEFDAKAYPMYFNLQTDGSGYETIIAYDGGAKNAGDGVMKMNGHQVLTFALKEVPENITTTIEFSEKDLSEIDHFVFHQANKLLNDSIRRKLKLPKESVPSTLHKYGNTSCATIPITMISELKNELEHNDLSLLLSGFGVGLSWGTAIVNVSNIVCPPLIEI